MCVCVCVCVCVCMGVCICSYMCVYKYIIMIKYPYMHLLRNTTVAIMNCVTSFQAIVLLA